MIHAIVMEEQSSEVHKSKIAHDHRCVEARSRTKLIVPSHALGYHHIIQPQTVDRIVWQFGIVVRLMRRSLMVSLAVD
jgi:hypothetical protein